jgi:hypothetical protein
MAIHAALEAGDYRGANALIGTMSSFEELRAEEGNGTMARRASPSYELTQRLRLAQGRDDCA